MKFFITIIFSFYAFFATSQEVDFLKNIYNFLENPEIFETNQEPGHVSGIISNQYITKNTSTDQVLNLNGTWKFMLVSKPDDIDVNFIKQDFSDKSWNNITVPGHWQMQGFSTPQFRNMSQPFVSNPPFIPKDYNPVGCYRRNFSFPKSWKDKEIFLRCEGAGSASFVWINGKEVGYNEGAMEPFEFDITNLLKSGDNQLSISVFQYADGTYLEDQDMWRLNGIFRDIYIYAVPKTHIQDYFVTTDLDNEYTNAILKVKTEILNKQLVNQNLKLKYTLKSYDGKIEVLNFESNAFTVKSNSTQTVQTNKEFINPNKWSSEKPYLYQLKIELINDQNQSIQTYYHSVGFREVELKNKAIYVNGVPIKFNGVCSHMQHPVTGHTMDIETMKKDLLLMKKYNINCVRTSHYPPNNEYLHLANELGMYIVCEVGDEAHDTEYLSDDPKWKNAYVERVQKMVLRDRNYPSIIFWSAGNESGWGNNICEVINEGKKLDPSRPAWMYGGNDDLDPKDNKIKCEDIVGPRYPTPIILKSRFALDTTDNRPSFMDEYLAATGNSLGGLDEIWDLIYEYPRLIGGAIWDWVSPGLAAKHIFTPDSSKYGNHGALMGNVKPVQGKFGNAISLSGHDEWIEVYRDKNIEVTGDKLTISIVLFANKWNGSRNSLVSKGFYQFGLDQKNNDTLEFYVTGKKRITLQAKLPSNWYSNWHHVVAQYDGVELAIFIDNVKINQISCNQLITEKPFPINIGRNPEIIGQEFNGYMSNAIFDHVSIFNYNPDISLLSKLDNQLKMKSLLWYDFNELKQGIDYFSIGIGGRTYGLVWPDRTEQPELEQLKKTTQPITVKWLLKSEKSVEIFNRYHFTNLNELEGEWKLRNQFKILQSGKLNITLSPLQKEKFIVPYQIPTINAGEEYWLEFSFKNKNVEVAWEQLELDKISETPILNQNSVGVSIVQYGNNIEISGSNFKYIFDKKQGTISSLVYEGNEFLETGPQTGIWRAALANDLDSWTMNHGKLGFYKQGFGLDVSNSWRVLGFDNMTNFVEKVEITNTNNTIKVFVKSRLTGNDFESAFENEFIYTIYSDGSLEVIHKILPCGLMPCWLPKAGMKLELKKEYDKIKWFGRGPLENYPDRKTGYKTGIYSSTAKSEFVPYIIPQDYGNKCDTRWVELENSKGTGLKISSQELFNHSVHIYDTDNLERATFPYQLKEYNKIVLNIDYAITGVGCTAISVLNQYRALPQTYQFVTKITPYVKK